MAAPDACERTVTTEPELINLTRSIRPLPDGRALCFGAAGPKAADAVVARILSSFSAFASRSALTRRAPGVPLSAAAVDGRPLEGVRSALIRLYGHALRREASYLLDDALRDRLLGERGPVSSDVAAGASPDVMRASTCDARLRRELRGRLGTAGGVSAPDADYCLATEEPQPSSGAVRNLGILATAGTPMIWIEDGSPASAPDSEADYVHDPDFGVLLEALGQYLGRQLVDVPPSVAPAPKADLGYEDWWQRYRANSWLAAIQIDATNDPRSNDASAVSRVERPALVVHPASAVLQLIALDNRRMLPPFVPDSEPLDRAWGRLLGLIYPSAVVLALPFTVSALSGRPDLSASLGPVRPADVLLQLLRTLSFPSAISDPRVRLSLVGRYLVSCGRMPDAALRRFAVPRVLSAAVVSERTHDTGGASTTLLGPIDDELPPDLASDVRDLLLHYGSLLMRWPEIWRAAATCTKERS
jgi:hypothetical protein